MKNIAIHPNQWRAFCEAFTESNQGGLMTVEQHHLDNRRDEIARETMFQKLTFDTSDACSDMLTLTLGQEGEPRINHIVVEPIHIRVKEHEAGRKLLQIEAETGVTLVSFHSGRFSLNGFDSEFKSFGKRNQAKEMAIPS